MDFEEYQRKNLERCKNRAELFALNCGGKIEFDGGRGFFVRYRHATASFSAHSTGVVILVPGGGYRYYETINQALAGEGF